MDTGTNPHCTPQFRLLREDQIMRLHQAALRVLDEVGVQVLNEEAVELLHDHGCRVEGAAGVRIPPFLVEETVRSAPSSLVIYDRQGREAMDLGGRRIYFGTGTDLPKTIDLKTREIRDTVEEDIRNNAAISDALREIDFIGSYGLARDVQAGLHYIRCFQLLVEGSTKPVFFTAESERDLAVILEMAEAVAGGGDALAARPFLINYSEPVSPLTHSREAAAKLMMCARRGVPINYTPALLAGSTGPVTIAGAITTAAAEALSGLVIHQLAGKGAPIISGFAATSMDMLKATVSYTSPEFRLAHSACSDLFHYYEIPVWGTAGCSDSQFPDLQAGAEYGFTLLNAALDGANLIHDCGYLGQGFVASPEMIVFAAEVIGYVKRYMRGFILDEDHLALNVIREVGPGGHFLGERHTLEFFQQEQWKPTFFNRDNLSGWMKQGSKKLDERLAQRALELLRDHTSSPLTDEVQAELNRIWGRALKQKEGES
ncbi:MAG: trimethylamine methyltransferase family protein [Desulfobacteraceae bacterium]